MRALLFLVFLASARLKGYSAEEILEYDFSERVQKDVVLYDSVLIQCYADSIFVEIKTVEKFSGVVYTEGSFYSREPSCFFNVVNSSTFTVNIPFDKCNTENDGEKFRNTLIVQHDNDLITWEARAFILECDSQLEYTVSADLKMIEKRSPRSSIALVDADPARDKNKRAAYAESYTDEVVLVPGAACKTKDELAPSS